MSRTKLTGMVLALVVVVVIGGWAFAGIEGSKHDFGAPGSDACAACHTPSRDETPSAAPLWDARADLSRRFGTAGVTGKRAAPGTGTTACLRCHDGTVARRVGIGFASGRYKARPTLARRGHGETNHPVGVDYPQFGKGYWPITTVLARGTVALPYGRVECASCHDPHNVAGTDKMLVTRNARSALCLTCHRK